MIVVAIIGLVVAIAIPNLVKAREKAEKNACIENLKQIQGAEQIWAITSGAVGTDTPTIADLVPSYIKIWPKCRSTPYVTVPVNTDPVCPNNLPGHTL